MGGEVGGGGAFTPDASELISGRTEQMLMSQTRQFTKASDLEKSLNLISFGTKTSNPTNKRRLIYWQT